MSTALAGDLLANRVAQLQQKRSSLSDKIKVFDRPETRPTLIIRPPTITWQELEERLAPLINLPGLWITVRYRYEAGQGAELETAAEIALAKAKKSPFHLFAAMVSKKSGNWETRTLKMVHDTWDVRRNALEVIERLKLPHANVKAILALSWRLRGTIIRYLAMSTEQGTGIKNPIGLFFALTKKPKPDTG